MEVGLQWDLAVLGLTLASYGIRDVGDHQTCRLYKMQIPEHGLLSDLSGAYGNVMPFGSKCCGVCGTRVGGVVSGQHGSIICFRDSTNPDDACAVINRTVIVIIIGESQPG